MPWEGHYYFSHTAYEKIEADKLSDCPGSHSK